MARLFRRFHLRIERVVTAVAVGVFLGIGLEQIDAVDHFLTVLVLVVVVMMMMVMMMMAVVVMMPMVQKLKNAMMVVMTAMALFAVQLLFELQQKPKSKGDQKRGAYNNKQRLYIDPANRLDRILTGCKLADIIRKQTEQIININDYRSFCAASRRASYNISLFWLSRSKNSRPYSSRA